MGRLNAGTARIAQLQTDFAAVRRRNITFSQAAGAPSITGGSPKFIVPADAQVVALYLSTVSAAVGSALTVRFLLNGSIFATLQIAENVTTTATTTGVLPSLVVGDELTVNAVEVGPSVPAQGITAMVVIS
jgi:hypothetical protein